MRARSSRRFKEEKVEWSVEFLEQAVGKLQREKDFSRSNLGGLKMGALKRARGKFFRAKWLTDGQRGYSEDHFPLWAHVESSIVFLALAGAKLRREKEGLPRR
ncbi:hypothetical protein KQX54_012403 [Cotesia glomerata]|uniref:Uncharacterized protein n=1 Tax=Cotesia glomerata TaxID=32391 RepID=A0AAV7IP44_COTGL|nr:hypothetical protein KQX54_012403 [Cotesia glomerata]